MSNPLRYRFRTRKYQHISFPQPSYITSLSESFTRQPILSMGLSNFFDNLSSERARPMDFKNNNWMEQRPVCLTGPMSNFLGMKDPPYWQLSLHTVICLHGRLSLELHLSAALSLMSYFSLLKIFLSALKMVACWFLYFRVWNMSA